jgi:hypothetical protein
VPYPDNMTMADDRTVLITSQALPALALHARFKASAPSAVYRLNPDTIGASPTLLFQDNGESIRAASTALWYGKKLYLGQPFGDGVLVVPIPDTGVDGVLRCELPAGDAKKETAVNAATPSR